MPSSFFENAILLLLHILQRLKLLECAQYGFDSDLKLDSPGLELSFVPSGLAELGLDEAAVNAHISQWLAKSQGTARITGSRAKNLNPIIMAHVQDGVTARGWFPDALPAWWWLFVGGAPAKYSAFNARIEKLTGSWRFAAAERAIVPAHWYVEKGKRFRLGAEPFGIAAITATTRLNDGSSLVSYALVTRDAVGSAQSVHPRMPLLLEPSMYEQWLDPQVPADDRLVREVYEASDELSHAAYVATPSSSAS